MTAPAEETYPPRRVGRHFVTGSPPSAVHVCGLADVHWSRPRSSAAYRSFTFAACRSGKPGSGKRKATEPDAQDHTENDENSKKWEREVAAAEAEAGVHGSGDRTEAANHYKMMVMVFCESDQVALQQALSNWSPVSKPLANKKQAHSVTVKADLAVIGDLLAKLGTMLQQNQPQKVKVSIER